MYLKQDSHRFNSQPAVSTREFLTISIAEPVIAYLILTFEFVLFWLGLTRLYA